MRTRNKTSEWTFRLTFPVLVLFALLEGLAVNTTDLADGNDLGTSPFDFTDAVYRAHHASLPSAAQQLHLLAAHRRLVRLAWTT